MEISARRWSVPSAFDWSVSFAIAHTCSSTFGAALRTVSTWERFKAHTPDLKEKSCRLNTTRSRNGSRLRASSSTVGHKASERLIRSNLVAEFVDVRSFGRFSNIFKLVFVLCALLSCLFLALGGDKNEHYRYE